MKFVNGFAPVYKTWCFKFVERRFANMVL